jgi:hypothetical protein
MSRGVIPRPCKIAVRARRSARNSSASARPSRIEAAIGRRVRARKGAHLEHVSWEVALPPEFNDTAFDDAFAGFRRLYHVKPLRAICAPDVLVRFAVLYARSGDDALARDLEYDGIPLVAAVITPGTIVFEGEVDEERMGDW